MRQILILAAALGLMGCNGSVDSAAFVEGVDGLRCSAKVLLVADTGERIDGDPVAELTLRVNPPADKPFEATIDAEVSPLAFPHKGDTLAVACDPSNPDSTQLIQ
jgi:hypothetical protein